MAVEGQPLSRNTTPIQTFRRQCRGMAGSTLPRILAYVGRQRRLPMQRGAHRLGCMGAESSTVTLVQENTSPRGQWPATLAPSMRSAQQMLCLNNQLLELHLVVEAFTNSQLLELHLVEEEVV